MTSNLSFNGNITTFLFTNPHDYVIYTQNVSDTEKIYKLRLDIQDPTKDIAVKLLKDVEENKLQEYFQFTVGSKENQKSYLVQKDHFWKKLGLHEYVNPSNLQKTLEYIFNSFMCLFNSYMKPVVSFDQPPIYKLPPELWENIASYAPESLQTIFKASKSPKLTKGILDAFNRSELSAAKLGFKTLEGVKIFIERFEIEITRLNLTGLSDNIDNNFIDEIVSLCPNLQHLSIPKSTIDMKGLQKILSLPKLETLDVIDCVHITNYYEDISLEHKNLKKFDFSGIPIGCKLNFPLLTNLSLSSFRITDDFLSLIVAPNLEYLRLEDVEVSDKGLQEMLKRVPNLNTLELLLCYNITEIVVPFVEKVNCSKCYNLTQIFASNAKEIDISLCHVLENIETPLAEKIKYSRCDKISEIPAPNAKEIDISYFDVLENIEAPLAEKIKYSRCDKISEISAPNAKEIDISYCDILENIEAPLAEKVRCSNCKKLSDLSAPNAKDINISHCKGINQISAPKAKEIRALYCDVLEKIEAPLAETVYYTGCKQVSQIFVPNAGVIIDGH